MSRAMILSFLTCKEKIYFFYIKLANCYQYKYVVDAMDCF